VKNHIYHVLSTYFAEKFKKTASTLNLPEGITLTQTLVDPLILKQGHLPADPTDSEIKELFLLLSNLEH
jgi:hypothetical protein